MAGASAKRIAADNERALQNLRYGMIISSTLYILLRVLLPFRSFPPSLGQLCVYILTGIPTVVLYQHLNNVGTPRRDPTTGTILSPGEDLSQRGLTESCWDVIYVTWFCQVGSSIFGDGFWWFYLVIPCYACFKLYTSIIGPMFFKSAPKTESDDSSSETQATGKTTSKRQEKLQKRNEKRTAVQTKTTRR